MRRMALKATGVAVGTGMMMLGTAMPASASVTGDYIGTSIAIRSGPSVGSARLGYGSQGQTVRADCYSRGDVVGDSDIWIHHRNLRTNVLGYSAAQYIRLNGSIPQC